MDEFPGAWLADVPIACFLVPNCFFAFDQWLIAMGVPLAAAVAGGMMLRRWLSVLLVGLACFGVHIAYQAFRWYALTDALSLPYGDLRLAVQVEIAANVFVIVTSAAFLAHCARRYSLWARGSHPP